MKTPSPKPIVCCGFTPCVQRIIELPRLEKGHVNRAVNVTVGIGGKGANTARMVCQLGADALLVGFAGGANGTMLEAMLGSEGVAFRHVAVSGETRICQTLVEQGNPETTELVEEMPPLLPEEWSAMANLVAALDMADAVVTVSGRLPAGAPADAYAQVAAAVAERGGRVVLDAPGEPLLRALPFCPLMVKINDVELAQTTGMSDLPSACRALLKKGAQSVLITRGRRSALFFDGAGSLELFPPTITAVNPVGSGDAVTAGLAVMLSRGVSVRDALAYGMACGAANALHLRSGFLRMDDVERLVAEVVSKPVGE